MKRLVSIAMLASLALAPSGALAHGRVPSLAQIAFHPSDPDHVVIAATWGFITTRDGGETWTWQCADAVFFDRSREDPSIAMFESDALLAGTYDGIRRSDEAQCGWATPATAPDQVFTTDVIRDPTDARVAWTIASSGTEPDVVLRSDDEGLTWVAVAEPHESALTDRIRVAPGDPTRIYTSGVIPRTDTEPRRGLVLRSEDRGETFRAIEVPLVDGELTVHVLGVDPTDADRVFARVTRSLADETPERLLLSEDGGETWRAVLEILEIVGLAIAEDGSEVWAGSWDGGLHRSSDGGLTWEALDPLLRVRCLAHRPGELWVCADDLSSSFALARSSDGGETLEPIWSFGELTPDVGCPASTDVGTRCPMFWPDMVFDLQLDAGVPLDGAMPADAGTGGGEGGGGGCACRAGPGASRAPAWSLALLALAALFVRRRLR